MSGDQQQIISQSKGDVWREKLQSVTVVKGSSLLHYAAQLDDTAVYICASQGCHINAQDAQGHTALHLAVQDNNVNTVRALLTCGANPTIRNKMGVAVEDMVTSEAIRSLIGTFKPGLLKTVAAADKVSLARLLRRWCHPHSIVKRGKSSLELLYSVAEVNEQARECLLLLHKHLPVLEFLHAVCSDNPGELAAALGRLDTEQLHARYSDCVGRTPLQVAIDNRSPQCVRLLLDATAPACVRVRVSESDLSSKKVPLFFKSLDKDCPIEVTQMLLEHLTPVGLEERDSKSYTAIHRAISNGSSIQVIDLLLNCHEDFYLTSRDKYGQTARELAWKKNRSDVIQLIDRHILSRQDITVFPVKQYDLQLLSRLEDDTGQSLSTVAAHNDAVAKVIANYTRIQLAGTLLFKAAQSGNTKVINRLNIADFQDRNGFSALHHAVVHNQVKAVESLIVGRPSLRLLTDNCGRSALHYAYILPDACSNVMVKLILEHDGSTIENLRDKDDLIPVQYKDRRDNEEIQEILNRAKTANPLVPFGKRAQSACSTVSDTIEDVTFDNDLDLLITCLDAQAVA